MNREKYRGAEKAAEVCQIMPQHAVEQMEKMIDQCRLTDHILSTDSNIVGNARQVTRAGFAAEEIHAETFNLEAILKDKNVRAFTDKYPNSPVSGNNTTYDIFVQADGKTVSKVQSKYYATAEDTATQFRTIDNGQIKYKEADAFLGPSDQMSGIKEAARRTELKNQSTRPQVAEAAHDVQQKVTDRIKHDGVQSKTLTKKNAELLVQKKSNNSQCLSDDAKELHKKQIQDPYKTASTLQQSLKAAGTAAVVSSAIAGTINTFHYLDLVQKGEMSMDEAVGKILLNTAVAAGDSALKAGGATMVVSLAARKFPDFFKGSVLQSSLKTGLVAGTAVCAIDLIECLVLFAAGKISKDELGTRTGMNIIQTATGSVGASIGAAVGAVGGPVGAMIGGIVGGMITSVATTMCIENHVEKPFREVMANTEAIVQTEKQLLQMINTARMVDAYFADFYRNFALGYEQSQRELALLHENGERIERNIEERAASTKQKQNALDQKIAQLFSDLDEH